MHLNTGARSKGDAGSKGEVRVRKGTQLKSQIESRPPLRPVPRVPFASRPLCLCVLSGLRLVWDVYHGLASVANAYRPVGA